MGRRIVVHDSLAADYVEKIHPKKTFKFLGVLLISKLKEEKWQNKQVI